MGQGCAVPIWGGVGPGTLGKDLSVGGFKGGLPRGASRLPRPEKPSAAAAAAAAASEDRGPPEAPQEQARVEPAVAAEDAPRREPGAPLAPSAAPSAPSAPARELDGLGRSGFAAAQACEDKRCGCRGDPRVPDGLGLTGMSKEAKINYTVVFVCLLIGMSVGVAKQSSAVCLYIGVLLVYLVVGDLIYSRFLANTIFQLSDDEVTPAHQEQNVSHPDFTPTPAFILIGHHWTSITGAAPIIGPALACYYGWLPAMLWVVFGALFAGCVHDFGVLVMSARMGGRSIGDLAGVVISRRARVLFLLLILLLCWIVVDYSYLGGHFTLHPTAVRRRQLLQTKLFECACSRCLAPELVRQPPCGAADCGGFLQPSAEASDGRWRCCRCSVDEEDGSDRLARYRRLEPMLLTKVDALEGKWHDPSKDVAKYIGDWEALAKSCGQMLGPRHHAYARACFFALQALNTGLSLKLGGVDAARHAGGLRSYGLPLARYLRACCPHGARCVSLEPVGAALVLIAGAREHRALAAEVVREAGHDELRLPLFDGPRNAALAKLLDGLAQEARDGAEAAEG